MSLIQCNIVSPEGELFSGEVFGFSGFGFDPGDIGLTPEYNPNYTYWTDFIFQAMFAATAATIVSGAIAERMKLSAFLIFSFFLILSCFFPALLSALRIKPANPNCPQSLESFSFLFFLATLSENFHN